jgi:hypothetical protein
MQRIISTKLRLLRAQIRTPVLRMDIGVVRVALAD